MAHTNKILDVSLHNSGQKIGYGFEDPLFTLIFTGKQ
jgi:hypothetical protein